MVFICLFYTHDSIRVTVTKSSFRYIRMSQVLFGTTPSATSEPNKNQLQQYFELNLLKVINWANYSLN
jgi:hypothetical protein